MMQIIGRYHKSRGNPYIRTRNVPPCCLSNSISLIVIQLDKEANVGKLAEGENRARIEFSFFFTLRTI